MSYLEALADIITLDEAGLSLFPVESNDNGNSAQPALPCPVGEDEGFIPVAA